jgi:hypothetical protein
VLDRAGQIDTRGKHLIDLSPQTLDRRYSTGHGRGSSLESLAASSGTYVRCHLHRRRDAT